MRNLIPTCCAALFGVLIVAACGNNAGTTEQAAEKMSKADSAAQVAAAVTPNEADNKPAPPSAAPDPSTERKTTIKFEETEYNWGVLKANDKMTHIFRFKNTGSEPLVIKDAKTTCGCTVPEKPQAPVEAGKTGEIKVVFDSHNKSGTQVKPITITSNTVPETTVLTIKGEVK